jgi:hypothetical protein
MASSVALHLPQAENETDKHLKNSGSADEGTLNSLRNMPAFPVWAQPYPATGPLFTLAACLLITR